MFKPPTEQNTGKKNLSGSSRMKGLPACPGQPAGHVTGIPENLITLTPQSQVQADSPYMKFSRAGTLSEVRSPANEKNTFEATRTVPVPVKKYPGAQGAGV